jgi:hypothetical protein
MNSSRLIGIVLGVALVLSARLAGAQTSSGVPGITASNVPVIASGQMPSATPGEEEIPGSSLKGSVSFGANYDDNALPSVTPRVWDVVYTVLPEIELRETHSRIVWALSYSPGFELSQQLLYQNQFAQKFGGTVAWRTSPHGSLSAQQYYLVTTNPFAGFATTQPGPTITPNETIYVPNVRQKMLMSNVLYSYQISAQTSFGLGGSFVRQQYDDIPHSGPSTSFIHAQIAMGNAYISHQFSASNQLGFQYGAQVLRFPQVDGRTTTHSFLVFDQITLSPVSSLTLYGGPEYSLTSNQVVVNLGFIIISIPVNANQWSASGGLVYNWTGERFGTTVNFSRRVSDGGAFFGAVELTTGEAQLVYQLSRNWGLTSSISGSDDQLLSGTSGGGNELKMYSGRLGLRRKLGQAFAIDWFYERLNETGSINGLTLGNRDILGATLQYSFLKPLGG